MSRLWLIGALVLAALGVAACEDELAKQLRSGRGGGPTDALRVDASRWRTDFSKHSVPLSEFQRGGPSRDGVPPVDEPKPTSQREADEWLSEREPVLVVELAGEARAYPLQILVWHQIVNDTLGGRPIAVTYCPLSNSSLVFDRRVRRGTLTFGNTGNLRKSDLVMWDRQTESWWQQLSAEAVVGELTGTRLTALPAQTLSWADFKGSYTRGDVLSRDTGARRDYGRTPYEGYEEPSSDPFMLPGVPDERLPPKERVAAVFAAGETVVYPFSRLAEDGVVNDDVGGHPVLVLFEKGVVSALDEPRIADSRDVGTAAAFERRAGDRTLEFERRDGRTVDLETGSTWDITGRAVSGELRGRRLNPIRHDVQFWFALAAFVPGARIAG